MNKYQAEAIARMLNGKVHNEGESYWVHIEQQNGFIVIARSMYDEAIYITQMNKIGDTISDVKL